MRFVRLVPAFVCVCLISGSALTAAVPAPPPLTQSTGCFTDTLQADFQAGVLSNCDAVTSPGDVRLTPAVAVDQQSLAVTSQGGLNNTQWLGQIFTAGVSGPLMKVEVLLACQSCSGTTPDILVDIRATNGTLPVGGNLASASIPSVSSNTAQFYTATFHSPLSVVAGTQYAIVVHTSSEPSAGNYVIQYGNPGNYEGGTGLASQNGTQWFAQSLDLAFTTYVQSTGYVSPGSVTSSVKDANPSAGRLTAWTTIAWNATEPANTGVQFQVAASNDINGPFDFVGPDQTAGTYFTNGGSLSQFKGKRYLRYRALLSTTASATPVLHDVTLCFKNLERPLDLDGDTQGDVFLYNTGSGQWQIQINQGDGTFAAESSSWDPNWTVAPARFNDDNLTDFFLFNATSGQWFRMLGSASGFATQATGTWWPGWQRHLMDLNGDGLTDAFLYDPATGVWFKSVSTPTDFTYSQGGWSPNWEITPMSLNDDAYSDMFLIDRTTGRWFWVLGEAGAGFTYPVTDVWFPGWNFHPGDFNGDIHSDFLLHDPATGKYFVAMNTGSGFSYTQGGWSLGWTPYVADFDADGQADLFLHSVTTGQWFQMLGNGSGEFSVAGNQTWSLGWTINFTDLNGDGRADVVLYHPDSGVWYQARNLALGTFVYTSGTWAPNWSVFVKPPFFTQ